MKKIKRGLIVWVDLNGDGSEQGGVRPCIIVQNNKGNTYSSTTIVIPLTKKTNKNGTLPTYTIIKAKDLGNNFSDSIALAEQVRVIDKSKIVSVGKSIPKTVINYIDKSMMVSLGINTA